MTSVEWRGGERKRGLLRVGWGAICFFGEAEKKNTKKFRDVYQNFRYSDQNVRNYDQNVGDVLQNV